MFSRSFSILIVCSSSLLAPFIIGSSCSATPGTGDSTAKSIAFHPETEDPALAVITSQDGEVVLYGTKEADGTPIHVDALAISYKGTEYSVSFDEFDRPIIATDDKGNVAKFTYTDTTLLIEFTATDGSQITETVPLDQIPNWPPTLTNAKKLELARLQQSGAGDTRIFVVTKLNLVKATGETLKELTDAVVDVTIGSGFRQIAGYEGDLIGYKTILYHRAEPLTITNQECADLATQGGRVVTHAGTGLAAIALLCAGSAVLSGGASTPLCVWLLSVKGAMLGLGVSAASSALTEASIYCSTPTVLAPADSPIYNLAFYVQHPSIQGGGQGFARTVDVTGLGNGAIVSVTLNVVARENHIFNITTTPSAPAEFQSYRIIFETTAPGFTLEYTIAGSDKFSRTETLTADVNSNTVTSSSIPGGKSGVVDTITARLIEPFSGEVLHVKTATLTFR